MIKQPQPYCLCCLRYIIYLYLGLEAISHSPKKKKTYYTKNKFFFKANYQQATNMIRKEKLKKKQIPYFVSKPIDFPDIKF